MLFRKKAGFSIDSEGGKHLKQVHAPEGAIQPGKLPVAKDAWWGDMQTLRKIAEGGVFVGLVLIIGVYGAQVYFRTGEAAHRTVCRDNLRRQGIALQAYSQDYDGCLPPSDSDLGSVMTRAGYTEMRFLLCPSDDLTRPHLRRRPGPPRTLISYTYQPPLQGNLDLVPDPSRTPLLWDRDGGVPTGAHRQGGNILFADGHTRWLPLNFWAAYDRPR